MAAMGTMDAFLLCQQIVAVLPLALGRRRSEAFKYERLTQDVQHCLAGRPLLSDGRGARMQILLNARGTFGGNGLAAHADASILESMDC